MEKPHREDEEQGEVIESLTRDLKPPRSVSIS